MTPEPQPRAERSHPPIGERLRAERQRRGIGLRDLAERVSLSPSLISQVETGRARPSVATLYAVAGELGISIDDLLFPNGLPGDVASGSQADIDGGVNLASAPGGPAERFVQRAGTRKRIRLASGVTWERLTPHSEPDTEFLFVTYEVGGASSPEHAFQRHGGHEWGYVLSGRLRVTIGFDEYELGPGDAVSLESSTPHRLANAGAEPVHAIWFVAGRNRPEHAATGGRGEERDPHA
ncbi:MAG TPA: XRE family transcriptional regulator [Candidatus Limnocylindrales bacterium]|nr:XRE family transcriptional regulator [Candidatus Limnocylindrales bacterium]